MTIYTAGFSTDFRERVPEVHFGNRSAKVAALSSFSLEVVVPPGTDGPVPIQIVGEVPGDRATLSMGFAYRAPERAEDLAGEWIDGALLTGATSGVPARPGLHSR